MSGTPLCKLDDIPDGASAGFNVTLGGREVPVLAVRKGDAVYVYENECPHVGTPLNFAPDEFLNDEGTMIECGTHMAQFRIEDGFCTEGPCEGDSLTPIASEIRDGAVFVKES